MLYAYCRLLGYANMLDRLRFGGTLLMLWNSQSAIWLKRNLLCEEMRSRRENIDCTIRKKRNELYIRWQQAPTAYALGSKRHGSYSQQRRCRHGVEIVWIAVEHCFCGNCRETLLWTKFKSNVLHPWSCLRSQIVHKSEQAAHYEGQFEDPDDIYEGGWPLSHWSCVEVHVVGDAAMPGVA